MPSRTYIPSFLKKAFRPRTNDCSWCGRSDLPYCNCPSNSVNSYCPNERPFKRGILYYCSLGCVCISPICFFAIRHVNRKQSQCRFCGSSPTKGRSKYYNKSERSRASIPWGLNINQQADTSSCRRNATKGELQDANRRYPKFNFSGAYARTKTQRTGIAWNKS